MNVPTETVIPWNWSVLLHEHKIDIEIDYEYNRKTHSIKIFRITIRDPLVIATHMYRGSDSKISPSYEINIDEIRSYNMRYGWYIPKCIKK
jgi:hypothetical protein